MDYNGHEMPVLPIVIGENTPILRAKTKPVKKITKEILKLIDDMEETVIASKGAGIAAPQVNRSERICIALLGGKLTPLVNPNVTWHSDTVSTAEEGCLSLPELWLQITRPTDIVVEFKTPDGKARELKLSGFDARVVQHEVDHLDGILIVDHRKNTLM